MTADFKLRDRNIGIEYILPNKDDAGETVSFSLDGRSLRHPAFRFVVNMELERSEGNFAGNYIAFARISDGKVTARFSAGYWERFHSQEIAAVLDDLDQFFLELNS